jgi:hypothetical protein
VELSGDHARNEASEWVELVEPDTPELGDRRLGDGNTAEQGELKEGVSDQNYSLEGRRDTHSNKNERIEQGRDEHIGRQGGEHLSESNRKDLGDEENEEVIACAIRSGLEASREVEQQEVDDCAQNTKETMSATRTKNIE